MCESIKPPLGARPACLVAWERIGELVEAIERQYESGHGKTELVRGWAEEIKLQCDIIERFSRDQAKVN